MKNVLFILMLCSLGTFAFTKEEYDLSAGIGGSLTNFTINGIGTSGEDGFEPYEAAILDYILNFNLFGAKTLYRFEDSPLSIRGGMILMPVRLFASLTAGVSYKTGRFQIYTGPSIAFDALYGPLRYITFEIIDSIASGRGYQDFWLYSGLETGINMDIGKNWGVSLTYKNSLFNITSIFEEENDKYSNRYDFISFGLYFK